VTSFIVFKKVNFNFNPTFGSAGIKIDTLPSGMATMNLDVNLTKPLNGKTKVVWPWSE
jgi:hypothetical protein